MSLEMARDKQTALRRHFFLFFWCMPNSYPANICSPEKSKFELSRNISNPRDRNFYFS